MVLWMCGKRILLNFGFTVYGGEGGSLNCSLFSITVSLAESLDCTVALSPAEIDSSL